MDILNGFDIASATLAGLAIIGVVNVVTIYRPETSSKAKFIISILVAFIIGFIPAGLGNEILTRIKDAITIAFAASGTYTIAKKAGGQ